MEQCGHVLSNIASIKFPKSGFFDRDLNVSKEFSDDEFHKHALKCLQSQTVKQQLGTDSVREIENLLLVHKAVLANKDRKHLVHGDFGPSNILVQKRNGRWIIVAILDWEFSFSGSVLSDIANMLRYASHVSPEFEAGFLKGVQEDVANILSDWPVIIRLLNLCSLLDCLARSDVIKTPLRRADIKSLIDEIILYFLSLGK
jgi:aminoglycoside phosphotransferase (APT) family kinase protein